MTKYYNRKAQEILQCDGAGLRNEYFSNYLPEPIQKIHNKYLFKHWSNLPIKNPMQTVY